MALRVVFSARAETQLVELHRYISERATPAIAECYPSTIVSYCESLSTFPMRGTLRNDIRPGLRTTGYKRRATIAFEATADAVNSLGVY